MCPPGQDQTGRGPQYWCIISPQTRQRQRLHGHQVGTANEVTPPGIDFWSRLARFEPEHFGISRVQAYLQQSRYVNEPRQRKASPLECLPTELLTLVTSNLDKGDMICLGMTCHFMMHFVLDLIKTDLCNTRPMFAGVPLAVVGNYLTDLPPAFFEDGLAYKSVAREDLISLDVDNGKSFSPARFHYWPARQYFWATSRKYEEVDPQSEISRFYAAFEESTPLSQESERIPRVLMSHALQERANKSCDAEKYYLRNLTTRELIQVCSCRGARDAHVIDSIIPLDSILLNRTLWTSRIKRSWANLNNKPGAEQADWAGHSFDIVSSKAHEAEFSYEYHDLPWTDVTKQIVVEISGTGWTTLARGGLSVR